MPIDRVVPPPEPAPTGRGFLQGRTALVTGAGRRIGAALVVSLARAGCAVVLHHLTSGSAARQTAELARQAGAEVHLIQGDLGDPRAAADLLPAAAGLAGRPIDLLVNNASTFDQGSVRDTTLEQWDQHQAVNLRAPFLLSQALAAGLPAQTCADIINLNDYRALHPGPDHFAYTISKVGLHGLTRSLALALAPRIRVNEVALGAILPPAGAPDSYVHALRREIPTGRFGAVAQVTSAVLFLLGNDGITGQTVCVDGGRHLGGPAKGG